MAETAMSQLKELVLDGLTIDGAHHKQWFLVEIAKLVLSPMEAEQQLEGIDPGTAP